MESVKPKKCLENNVLILYYHGLWQQKHELTDWKSHLLHLYPYAQLFRQSYSFIFQCMNIYLSRNDVKYMSEYIFVLLFYCMIGCKLANLLIHRVKIREILTTLVELNNSNYAHLPHNAKVLQTVDWVCQSLTKYMGIFYIFTSAVLGTVIIVQAIATQKIPFRLWLPYDYSASPVYEITTVTISVLMVFDCFLEFVSASALVISIIHMYGQLKVLRYNLENLREIVKYRLNIDDEDTRDSAIQKWNITADALLLDVASLRRSGVCIVDMEPRTPNKSANVAGQDVDARRFRPDAVHETGILVNVVKRRWLNAKNVITSRKIRERKVNIEMEHVLANWVIHHQTLIRLSLDINDVFGIAMRFQLLATTLVGFAGLYIKTVADSLFDTKVLITSVCVFSMATEFLFYCVVADLLTSESELLHDAAYASDWLEATEGFKRSVCIIMNRTQRHLYIKAGGISLSRRTFRSACKSAYYLHMLLDRLYSGEKIFRKTKEA